MNFNKISIISITLKKQKIILSTYEKILSSG